MPLILSLLALPPLALAGTPETAMRAAFGAACAKPDITAETLAAEAGLTSIAAEAITDGDRDVGWRRRFGDVDGGRLDMIRLSVIGVTRISARYAVSAAEGERPVLAASAERDCEAIDARRMVYDADGVAETIELLDRDFAPTGETVPVNPPVPSGDAKAGVVIALLDTGVNYLLPEIAGALARNEEGRLVGYDYWDMDDRPFDANTAGSAFYPARHGTRVASAVIGETSAAQLAVYRYPMPEPDRIGALLDDVEDHHVHIALVTVNGVNPDSWHAFESAARAHPEILFVVSAGNGGRDIDRSPQFPASLDIPNMVVVTGADGFGDPLPGANWGKRTVDVLVPAERVSVTDFDGSRVESSGPDIAAARVAGMAADLLAADPSLTTDALHDAIIGRASMVDTAGPLWVGYGVLDLAARF